MSKRKYAKRRSQAAVVGGPRVAQRGIGTFVRRDSKQATTKGEKVYRKYWIYVPTDLAEDKNFPFKPTERLLIAITEGKRLAVEKA